MDNARMNISFYDIQNGWLIYLTQREAFTLATCLEELNMVALLASPC